MKCTPTKWVQFTSQVMDGFKFRQQTLGEKDGWATLAKGAKKRGVKMKSKQKMGDCASSISVFLNSHHLSSRTVFLLLI